MKKYEQIRKVIEEVCKDKKPHDLVEIRETCERLGIDVETDKNAISNVVFGMKKKGKLRNCGEKGVYELVETDALDKEAADREPVTGQTALLNWNEFFVLEPETERYQELKVTISEKGEIKLNARLQKKIMTNAVELIFSKDYKTILLNPDGRNPHVFNKAGIARNHDITDHLQQLKLKFPIIYTVKWDDEYKMWMGNINSQSVMDKKPDKDQRWKDKVPARKYGL